MKGNPRIKLLRKEMGMTQKDLASVLNVTRSTVNAYENGQCRISDEIITRLSNLFDVDPNYLLGNTSERKPFNRSTLDVKQVIQDLISCLSSDDEIKYGSTNIVGAPRNLLITSLRHCLDVVQTFNEKE